MVANSSLCICMCLSNVFGNAYILTATQIGRKAFSRTASIRAYPNNLLGAFKVLISRQRRMSEPDFDSSLVSVYDSILQAYRYVNDSESDIRHVSAK